MLTTILLALAATTLFKKKKMTSPVKGKITSGFGTRILFGKEHFHNGNDISVPTGTPVLAPASGTVTAAWNDTMYGGGLSLVIKHDNGDQSGFAHLSGFKAVVGQKVKEGETVAMSGNTGLSTGPHLHFTFFLKGKNVDATKTGLFNIGKKSDGSLWFE